MGRQMGYCVAAAILLVWANSALHQNAPLQSASLGVMGCALTIMALAESYPLKKVWVVRGLASVLFGLGLIVVTVLLLRGA